MSIGQGNISLTSPPGGSGTGPVFVGARNGLSLDAGGYVVLGEDFGAAGDPAQLLNARYLPMYQKGMVLEFDHDQFAGIYVNVDAPIDFMSTEAGRWIVWTPSNYDDVYTPGGRASRFLSGYDLYNGVNPDSLRPNVVGMFWGYNIDYNQGRIDTGEAAFRYATETFFEIDSDYFMEFHTPELTTDGGTIYRLDSTYVSRSTGAGFRTLIINEMSWFDTTHDPSGGQFYLDMSYTVSSDLARLIVRSQHTGNVSEIILGNWSDGNATIVFQDNNFNLDSNGTLGLNSPVIFFNPSLYTVQAGQMVVSLTPGASPGGNALLDLQSTTKGFMVPRMTTTQRLAIDLTVELTGGLIVYDTTINKLYVTTGAAPTIGWEQIQSV